MSQTTTPPQPAMSPAEAKAAAKAAKAYAKSLRPWYKKKRFIVPGALVALTIIGSATSGGGAEEAGSAAGGEVSGASAADAGAAQAAEVEVAAGIGTPVRDGKFEFVVNGIECGATEVGNEYFNEQAQGQYCMLDLTITNIGDEAQYFSGENVTLYNAEGQKYSADTGASIYLEDSSSVFEEINPGNTLAGTVVFDIPAGASPVEVELRDSAFSGGVKVKLA